MDKEASSGFLPAKSFTKVLSTKKNETTNVPTTLNGCPFSMMLNPFLMSAVVAVPARTCFMCDDLGKERRERLVNSTTRKRNKSRHFRRGKKSAHLKDTSRESGGRCFFAREREFLVNDLGSRRL